MAEKVWFYLFAGKDYGPVDEIKIRELLDLKAINGDARVWRQGMTQWEKLATTDLAEILRESNISNNSQPAPELVSRKPPFPRNELQGDYKKWYITYFFFIGECVINLGYLLFKVPIPRAIYVSLVCLFDIPILINMIFSLVLLYKYWEIIQDGKASTTPAKAVGFMFIPVFNLYWRFRAYWYLSKGVNRYINTLPTEAKPIVTLSKEWLSLLFAILSLVEVIIPFSALIRLTLESKEPIVSYFLRGLQLPIWYSITVNFVSLILIVIQGLVYVDLYRSTNSILQVQEIE